MAASTAKDKTAVPDDVDKLFDQVKDPDAVDGSEDDFADMDDLLGSVEEDDSEGWVPKEKGEGIAGIVTKVGETRSDFAKPGEDAMCPTVVIKCKDAEDPRGFVKWRIIGYGTVLKREMIDHDPQVGDKMAVRYWGEKVIKNGPYKGKMYKHFGIVVQKG